MSIGKTEAHDDVRLAVFGSHLQPEVMLFGRWHLVYIYPGCWLAPSVHSCESGLRVKETKTILVTEREREREREREGETERERGQRDTCMHVNACAHI